MWCIITLVGSLCAVSAWWHADKNPVLTEFATEVTKLINEAVAEAEAAAQGQAS